MMGVPKAISSRDHSDHSWTLRGHRDKFIVHILLMQIKWIYIVMMIIINCYGKLHVSNYYIEQYIFIVIFINIYIYIMVIVLMMIIIIIIIIFIIYIILFIYYVFMCIIYGILILHDGSYIYVYVFIYICRVMVPMYFLMDYIYIYTRHYTYSIIHIYIYTHVYYHIYYIHTYIYWECTVCNPTLNWRIEAWHHMNIMFHPCSLTRSGMLPTFIIPSRYLT